MAKYKAATLSVLEERLDHMIEFLRSNIPPSALKDFEQEIEGPVRRAKESGDAIDMAQMFAYLLLPKYNLDEKVLADLLTKLLRGVVRDYQAYVSTTIEVAKIRRNRLLRSVA